MPQDLFGYGGGDGKAVLLFGRQQTLLEPIGKSQNKDVKKACIGQPQGAEVQVFPMRKLLQRYRENYG